MSENVTNIEDLAQAAGLDIQDGTPFDDSAEQQQEPVFEQEQEQTQFLNTKHNLKLDQERNSSKVLLMKNLIPKRTSMR